MLDLLIVNALYPDFGNYQTGKANSGASLKKANIGPR